MFFRKNICQIGKDYDVREKCRENSDDKKICMIFANVLKGWLVNMDLLLDCRYTE